MGAHLKAKIALGMALALLAGIGFADGTADGVVLGEEDLAERGEILRNTFRRITPGDSSPDFALFVSPAGMEWISGKKFYALADETRKSASDRKLSASGSHAREIQEGSSGARSPSSFQRAPVIRGRHESSNSSIGET